MIIHILSDGTQVDSIEGRVLPLNERTRKVYELLAEESEEFKNLKRHKKQNQIEALISKWERGMFNVKK